MGLKAELSIRIKEAMEKKGIPSYRKLLEKSGVKMNPIFSDIVYGRQQIKEEDLLKISETLEIPMEFFISKMEKEVKYRVVDTQPVAGDYEIGIKRTENVKEYTRLYRKKWRARKKAQKEVIK